MTNPDPSRPETSESTEDLGDPLPRWEAHSSHPDVMQVGTASPAGQVGSSKSIADSKTVRTPRLGSAPSGSTSAGSTSGEGRSDLSIDEGSMPKQLGDYELIEEIARGGMGVVFRAKQGRLNRIVALKLILAGQLAGDEEVLRFQSEAEAAANLQHPSIVPIYEVGEIGGHHFFSMALIEGKTLADTIRNGPMSGHRAARIMAQVADAIDYAHQRGIMHRDLKPSNVLISDNGHAIVTDFGLAKRTDSGSQLTGTGQVVGTPSYMSPEQAGGFSEEIGPISDVYSLGAILYYLLTGRPPFIAANMMLTLRQVIAQSPVAPRALNADIDRDLETICLRCLEKDPAARYPTAAEFAKDLRRFLGSERIKSRPVGRATKLSRWCRRNPAIATLGSALALAVVLLSIVSPLLAYKETQLREQSDLVAKRTQELVSDLQTSVQETQEAKEQSERSMAAMHDILVEMYVDRGDVEVEQSDPVAALPSYAAALALDAGEPEREWGHRLRLTSILREAPRPISIWKLTAETCASTVSADGELVAAAGRDGRIDIWNTSRNAKVAGPIDTNSNVVTVLRFSPDNRWLLVGAGKELRLIDVKSGETEFVSQRLQESIRDAVFYTRPNQIVLALRSGAVLLVDTKENRSPKALADHDGAINCIDSSPLAGRLVTASDDHSGKLLDLETGALIATLQHDAPVNWTCFDLSGKLVATASDDGFVKLWNAETGEAVCAPINHGARIRTVKFDPSGSRVASGGWDSKAKIWDVATGMQLGDSLSHDNSIPRLDFSPNGRFLVTASLDHRARIWDTETGLEACPAMHHGFLVENVAFLPDGERLVTASGDMMIRVWSYRAISQKRTQMEPGGIVLRCAIDPTGKTLLTACENGSVRLWDARSGQPRGIEIQHRAATVDGTFSHDGLLFATCGSDNRARVWSSIDGSAITKWLEHDGAVNTVEFSPNDRFLLTASKDNQARSWNIRTGKAVVAVRHRNDVNQATFSPDGKHFLTCSDDKTARVWSAANGEPVSPFLQHHDRIAGCCFDHRGEFVATASKDHTGQIWQAISGKKIGKPLDHDGGVYTIAFSPKDDRVLTGARDGTARLWDARDGRPVTPPMSISRGLVKARFSPCGLYVGTGCGMTATLWDASDGRLLAAGMNHRNWVNDVLFSPDSSSMISCSDDGSACIWRIPRPLALSVSQLENLADLFAGHRVDPQEGLRPLTPEEAVELLNQVSSLPID